MANVTALQATPQGEIKPEESSLKACAQKLIDAVHAKDADAVAAALQEALNYEDSSEQA